MEYEMGKTNNKGQEKICANMERDEKIRMSMGGEYVTANGKRINLCNKVYAKMVKKWSMLTEKVNSENIYGQ